MQAHPAVFGSPALDTGTWFQPWCAPYVLIIAVLLAPREYTVITVMHAWEYRQSLGNCR